MNVIVLVSDGIDTAIQSFTISVENVNDTPQIKFTTAALTCFEDTGIFFFNTDFTDYTDSDVNDTFGNLTISVLDTDLIKVAVVKTANQCNFVFTTIADVFGTDTITIKVSDSVGALTTKNIVLTILPVNDTPVFTSTPILTATQGILYSYQLAATDIENDVIGYQLSVISCPAGMTMTDTGLIQWIPNAAQIGNYNVSVSAGDGKDTAIRSFVIIVANVNDAPKILFTTNSITCFEDTGIFFFNTDSTDYTDSDVSDTFGNLTISVLDTDLIKVAVVKTANQCTFVFTTISNVFGSDTVTIKLTDTAGAFDLKSFVVTILSVNDSPVITSVAQTIAYSRLPYSYTITAVDPDDSILTFASNLPLPVGVVISDTSNTSVKIIFTPYSTDTITISFSVNDAAGAFATQITTITVLDGPRHIQMLKVALNTDSTVSINWLPPLFNRVKQYILTIKENDSNVIFASTFDSNILTVVIPETYFIANKEYSVIVIAVDLNNNIPTDNPPKETLLYQPANQITVKPHAEILYNFADRKVLISNFNKQNFLLSAKFKGDMAQIDYIECEYRRNGDTQWLDMSIERKTNNRVDPSGIKADNMTVAWNLLQNNIVDGVYNVRFVTVYKTGVIDTSASYANITFTSIFEEAEIAAKIDALANTAYIMIKTAVGAETISQYLPQVKTINGVEIQKNVSIIIPDDVISSNLRNSIYGINGMLQTVNF